MGRRFNRNDNGNIEANVNKNVLGILILCVVSFTLSTFLYIPIHFEPNSQDAIISPSDAGEIVLHDMLHCFHEGNLTHTLDNLQFDATYNYKITLTVETDHHGAQLNATLIDPEGDVYLIQNTTEILYYQSPSVCLFGAAITGTYTINFEKFNGPNVNIRIKITKEDHCLQFSTDDEDHNLVHFADRVYYDVIKVSKLISGDPRAYSWVRYLDTDQTYKFYIGRVSPVAKWYASDTRLYFNITSPSGVLYQIWDKWPDGEWYNNSLPSAHYHKYFPFGTVGTGDYIIDFAFEQEPEHVNIAMVITYDEPASEQIDSQTNETTPPDNNSTTNDTSPIISYLIPPEAYISMGIFASMLVVAVMILIVKNKYKTNN